MIHRFGRHIAFMEKIAAHNDEIDLFTNRVFLQNINPRIEKIARRFVELITRAAEVHVRDMKEFHTVIIKQFQRKVAGAQSRKRIFKSSKICPKIFASLRLCASSVKLKFETL